jgi:hypothetical protein
MATLAAERFKGGSARETAIVSFQRGQAIAEGQRTGLFRLWQFEQGLKEREDTMVVEVLEEPLRLRIVLTESRALKSVPKESQHRAGVPSTGGQGRGTGAQAGCFLRRSRPQGP